MFLFFANNVLAILLKMETFSGSSMFQSQKRSQSKNEDQEKNEILTQIFQGTIGIEVWIRLKNPRRSRRIQKEQIKSQFFATALFNTIIKTGSIFRPTPVYKMVDSRQQAKPFSRKNSRKLKCPKVFPSQPLQTQICTYKMVRLLKRWFLYRMAS